VRASGLGLILGLTLCAEAMWAMRSVLHGVGIYDTLTIVCVALILASVTLLAGSRSHAANCTNRPCADAARRMRRCDDSFRLAGLK
jgi:hypothetical protein